MMQYKVFTHASGSTEVVKQGWSWPGFLFNFIWALSKKMWGTGLYLGLFFALLLVSVFTPQKAGIHAAIELLGHVYVFVLSIVVGAKGNSWREKKLVSRGFEHVDTLSAANSAGAMALYQKAANMQSASPVARSGTASS